MSRSLFLLLIGLTICQIGETFSESKGEIDTKNEAQKEFGVLTPKENEELEYLIKSWKEIETSIQISSIGAENQKIVVVDFGSGEGYTSLQLAQLFPSGVVLSVESNLAKILKHRQEIEKLGVSNNYVCYTEFSRHLFTRLFQSDQYFDFQVILGRLGSPGILASQEEFCSFTGQLLKRAKTSFIQLPFVVGKKANTRKEWWTEKPSEISVLKDCLLSVGLQATVFVVGTERLDNDIDVLGKKVFRVDNLDFDLSPKAFNKDSQNSTISEQQQQQSQSQNKVSQHLAKNYNCSTTLRTFDCQYLSKLIPHTELPKDTDSLSFINEGHYVSQDPITFCEKVGDVVRLEVPRILSPQVAIRWVGIFVTFLFFFAWLLKTHQKQSKKSF